MQKVLAEWLKRWHAYLARGNPWVQPQSSGEKKKNKQLCLVQFRQLLLATEIKLSKSKKDGWLQSFQQLKNKTQGDEDTAHL
jgi:hypothetical protein